MADLARRSHNHVFLGENDEKNERCTWAVIVLCTIMMVAEIVGGLLFGSIALVADGLHMSTHASAFLQRSPTATPAGMPKTRAFPSAQASSVTSLAIQAPSFWQ